VASDRKSADARFAAVVRALRVAKPVALRAVCANGDEHAIAIVGQRGHYDRAARSLLALGATLAHCLDSEGHVTESIAVGTESAEAAGSAAAGAHQVRTVNQDLAALMKIVTEAQDKVGLRYEAQLTHIREMAQQTTNAAVGVMKVAADRARHLEGAVLRLTLAREHELNERERELHKLAAEIQRDRDSDDEEADEKMDPVIREIIDIAKGGMSMPNGKAKAKPE
jgi:hypothetical protein